MRDAYGYSQPKYAHILAGDFFEACNLHPCLCTIGNEFDGDDSVSGISLVDGSEVFCSAFNCGVERLTFAQALERRARLLAPIPAAPSGVSTEGAAWASEARA